MQLIDVYLHVCQKKIVHTQKVTAEINLHKCVYCIEASGEKRKINKFKIKQGK